MEKLLFWQVAVASNLGLALGLLVLGLAVLGLGVQHFRAGRQAAAPRRRGRPAAEILLGLLLVGFVVGSVARFPAFLLTFLQVDATDAARLEALQGAPLAAPTVPAAAPGEWAQWRGPNRDGVATETGLRTDWTGQPPTVVWKQPLGPGFSAVSVAHGRLYTMDRQGDRERVVCLDAATGKELWAHAYPADFGKIAAGEGAPPVGRPRATPTVHDGRVYTVGALGKFLCLEATPATAAAKVLWEHDLAAEYHLFDDSPPRFRQWGMTCSPLIEGDLVVVQPGGANGSVVAFDRQSGQVRWQSLDDQTGYSSPVAVTVAGVRQILALTGQRAVGLRPGDGALLWSYDFLPKFHANAATPVVAGDYVFISANYDMGCALLQITGDGRGGATAAPVYFRANKLMRNHHASAVLHDGYLYGFDNHFLKCVDLRTGTEKWNAGRAVEKGCLVAADGHLLVLTEKGLLVLVEAAPGAFRKKGQLQVLEDSGNTWALPSLAGGRLYLRDSTQIVCLDVHQ